MEDNSKNETGCPKHTYITQEEERTLARLICGELKRETPPQERTPAPAGLCDLIF